MPSKSIFRQPGARHFQLVHRSQRDPLIHDPDAPQHVFKAFERENVKKGKTRGDLENILAQSDTDKDFPDNIGEAALYGIYYDDSEYDYIQHLRQIGVHEEGVESVLLEAPSATRKAAGKRRDRDAKPFQGLVEDNPSELPLTYECQEAVPSSIAGLQPDMDPHLRQVLEALEDDAFVDDDLQDDFFTHLVADGERDEDVQFEFHEDPDSTCEVEGHEASDAGGASWEVKFQQFKNNQKARPASDSGSDLGCESEGGDTVNGLPKIHVIGGKRRRKGSSNASGYSMSSSSLTRTEALQTLDEQFDQIILKEYGSGDDVDGESLSDDQDTAPQLLTTRDGLDGMMDEFLGDYEILGRKMKLKPEREKNMSELEMIRKTLGRNEHMESHADESDEEENILLVDDADEHDRWDCETILTTYSNLENHPRLIRMRESKPDPKIRLDHRTGFPALADREPGVNGTATKDKLCSPVTISRPRNESKEEKKLRKQAVKSERQTRRVEKRATKEQFSAEFERQRREIVSKGNAKTRKL